MTEDFRPIKKETVYFNIFKLYSVLLASDREIIYELETLKSEYNDKHAPILISQKMLIQLKEINNDIHPMMDIYTQFIKELLVT